jgi:hypothetical protein
MPEVVAIQFTQDQTRTLIGVSAETVRHWRKAIPYLASKTGKTARFSFTDLLGLAVTNELVNSLGVQITTVSTGVDALFRLLATSSPVALEGALVFVTATAAILREAGPDGVGPVPAEPALTISLTPFIAKIQQRMLPLMPVSTQTVLPFPPEPVRSRA